MQESLYPYQKEGILFGIRNFGRVLIGDEMGVGKSIQAIAIACIYRYDWPLLLIVPSTLVRFRFIRNSLGFKN